MEYTVSIEDGKALRGFHTWQNAVTYAINHTEKQKYAWIYTVDGDFIALVYKYLDGFVSVTDRN